MPARSLTVAGRAWRVYPSGRVTQYDRDEFGLLFVAESNGQREVRVTRYAPVGVRSRERSLADMTETELTRLLERSQPGDTSPEAGYRR